MNPFADMLPEVVALAGAVGYFIAAAVAGQAKPDRSPGVGTGAAALYLFAVAALILRPAGPADAGYLRLAALFSGFGVAILLDRTVARTVVLEAQGCLAVAVAGAGVAARAGDLVTLFVALEMVSIPTYVILALAAPDRKGVEATLKYFFISVAASAFFLLGLALLYGSAGTMAFKEIAAASQAASKFAQPIAQLGGILALIGLSSKLTVVPFYVYASDVYAGTRSATVALLATLPKVAGLAGLIAVAGALPVPAEGRTPPFYEVLTVVAVLSMAVGAVGTLASRDLPRFLAYSSVAHGGYMVAGLLGRDSFQWGDRSAAAAFYALTYVVATVGFVALHVGRRRGSAAPTDALGVASLPAATGWRTAGALAGALLLLSMAGIPPTVGFWGKFRVVYALMTAATVQGAVVTATIFVASAVAVLGYLRFVERSAMTVVTEKAPMPLPVACAALVAALFLWPGAIDSLLPR